MERVNPLLLSFISLLLLALLACGGGDKPTPTPPAALLTGKALDPEMVSVGQRMFLERGCGGCHTIDGLKGASGRVGPQLNGVATRGGDRLPGLNSEQYIRQSLEAPDAFVVPGYLPRMPDILGDMTPQQYEALVSYLLTLE